MIKYLRYNIQAVGLPITCTIKFKKKIENIKKKKKCSENDQLTGHFQSFFLFFSSPQP